jgi:hypothetical protein
VQRIDTIRVFCDVPENDVPHLHVGDPAIVKPSGFDGPALNRASMQAMPLSTGKALRLPARHLQPGTSSMAASQGRLIWDSPRRSRRSQRSRHCAIEF